MAPMRPEAVLLDMGGVILRMAGGHGFPHTRLDFRGRQAMLQEMGRASGRASLEDLETLVFGPWRTQYDRREETGTEADWSPHLERLRAETGSTIMVSGESGTGKELIARAIHHHSGREDAPFVSIPDAHHHVILDQPLAFVAALRTLLADWEHSIPRSHL